MEDRSIGAPNAMSSTELSNRSTTKWALGQSFSVAIDFKDEMLYA